MTVKEVICDALRLVGRDDAADEISSAADGEELSKECSRLQRAFLTYLNSVSDELARGYFPVAASEELSLSEGFAKFSSLTYTPVRIKRALKDGKPIAFGISNGGIAADAEKITVEYECVPAEFALSDDFVSPFMEAGARLLECGMAAEHFLVLGDSSQAAAWEEKYRTEAEAVAARYARGGRVSFGRWL